MKTRTLALAALLASIANPALASTLVDHVDGLQVDGNGKLERFTAILIGDDGKVVKLYHGTEARVEADTVIDGRGRVLMPGLIDAHGHVTDLGFAAMRLNLVGSASLQDLQQRLKAYAAAQPGTGWIIGGGWNQELWPDRKFPTAADLDAIVPDRPVILERVDGHAVVVNSAAMRAAGITADTKAPAGGRIENGVFVDAATDLVRKAVPKPTTAQLDAALAKSQDILLSVGVTGVGSMSTSEADWQAFRRAGEKGALNVRLMAYLLGTESDLSVDEPTDWLYGDRLRAGGVKLFADGALGSRGAWLKQPYADAPDSHGLRFNSDPDLLKLADGYAAKGFQIATHAIGDAANAQAIGVYEILSKHYGNDRRWRIEHAQVIDVADLDRLKPAGIIASMQPTHATSDKNMAGDRLGEKRLEGAYAWATLTRMGVPMAFGSDFPVESPNPFEGLHAALTRQDLQGQPPGGWRPQEKLSFAQALYDFTRGAAYAGFAEKIIGSLDPGHYADFLIVDRDPSKAQGLDLAKTQVLETWVGGKKVYEKASAPSR